MQMHEPLRPPRRGSSRGSSHQRPHTLTAHRLSRHASEASHLDSPPLVPAQPRRDQKRTPDQQHAAGEDLAVDVPALLPLYQGALNRRSRQHRKGHDREDHAHARALHARVLRQGAQRRGEQALDRGPDEPVDDGPGVEAGHGGHGDPGEGEERGDQAGGDEGVEGPEEAVGEEVGDDAAEDADAVEGDEEVDGGGEGQVRDGVGVGG